MKSWKYLAIAAAVAGVAVTASPADAGSVGTKGGNVDYQSKTTVVRDEVQGKDKIVEKTKDVWGKDIEEKGKNTSSTKWKDDKVNTNKSYKVNIYAVHDLFGGNGDWEYAGSKTFDSKNQAKNAKASMAKTAVSTGRSGFSSLSSDGSGVWGWGNGTRGYGKYQLGWDASIGSWSKDSSSKSYVKTTESKKTKDHRDYDRTVETKSDGGTAYTGTTEKFLGSDKEFLSRKYEFNNGDSILIGDRDNMSSAYAAQGTTKVTDSYKQTDHYLLTDNYTHTTINTKQKVYKNYTETITTKQKVYNENIVYKANMTVSVTPIVLDLDGDGKIEASNGQYLPHKGDFSQNVVMFDFYGDGFPVAMEWVGTNDGLLCRPEADGTVKGTNLFGSANGYANGYDELASLDVNRDGALTGEELTGLMVWQDENHNGVADKGELKSLTELGITSIGTKAEKLSSTYIRDGKTFKSFDWNPSVEQVRKIDVAR